MGPFETEERARNAAGEFQIAGLLDKINDVILNPLLVLLFLVAAVVFVFGLLRFIYSADDTTVRENGKRHMLYGVIGMVIMLSVYGIIALLLSTFGISQVDENADDYLFNGPGDSRINQDI